MIFIGHLYITNKNCTCFLQTYDKSQDILSKDWFQLYTKLNLGGSFAFYSTEIITTDGAVVIKSKKDDWCKSFISHSIKIAHFCANI